MSRLQTLGVKYEALANEALTFDPILGSLTIFGVTGTITGEWSRQIDFASSSRYPNGRPSLKLEKTAVRTALLRAVDEFYYHSGDTSPTEMVLTLTPQCAVELILEKDDLQARLLKGNAVTYDSANMQLVFTEPYRISLQHVKLIIRKNIPFSSVSSPE